MAKNKLDPHIRTAGVSLIYTLIVFAVFYLLNVPVDPPVAWVIIYLLFLMYLEK